ncbi:MAG: FKBP-type peptidyl-prolyl cis-trans isomerase [Crocinitomicaceae bacterium]|nr:FKBP-type peptidyl-prolyl cis-trans isomerase [Crocinitomicaceae bacterium]MBK8924640.1 FKBP-type peptidyl-prolyl cis-trans isomerase [Crocinitomicaceae bacterium]
MKKIWFIMTGAVMVACGSTTENTTTTTETTQKTVEETVEEVIPEVQYVADSSAEETIQKYLKEKKWEGVRHESGMYVVTDNPGEGEDRPNLNHEVTIFYKGYLLDGTQFDGTDTEPATFPLSNLIAGWQLGIPMFGKGGKGKLIIPAGLAYGPDDYLDQNGEVLIPGNSTLMFEIELIDWQKAQQRGFPW